nr:hypothetical protein [Tanacetum cinerariifolium]
MSHIFYVIKSPQSTMSSACDYVACEALDVFCNTFHISEEVHLVLPNQDDTMHERPAGKIGLYTRFFNFASFRLPLSTFFVVGLFWCFYINSKKSGWMSFSKHSDNAADPAPVAADFNAQDYATLVAHPSPFWKFPKAFLCLVGLSRHYTLDEHTYPSKHPLRVVEREREVNEPRLLDTTVGRTIPLLSVAPDRADNELEASVERLFDEGGSGTQTEKGDFARGGPDADIQPVVRAANIITEDATLVRLRHQGNRKSVAVDVGDASHPPKKLREDHKTPSETSIANSSYHSGLTIAEAEVDSLVRSSTPVMITATTITSMVDSTLVAKEGTIKPSLLLLILLQLVEAIPTLVSFHIFSAVTFLSRLDDGHVCREMVDEFAPPKFFASVRGMKHDQLFIEFNAEAARQMSLSAEVRMLAKYNVKERRRLQSVVEKQDELLKAKDGEIKNLKAQTVVKGRRTVILEKERDALDVKVTYLEVSVVGKERDLTDLNAQLISVKSENDSLVDQVYKLEVSSAELQEKITVYDDCMKQLEKFQDEWMKVVNDKLVKLDLDLAEMACHLEEKFYPHLLNTIPGRRWLLTHGLKLFLVKCLSSSEYLTALRAAISRAIEKGMQSGLAIGIDHGREGRRLADVFVYNPDAKVDFNTALRELREVDFPFLAELKSYKDASTEDIMNVLRLEGALADALG